MAFLQEEIDYYPANSGFRYAPLDEKMREILVKAEIPLEEAIYRFSRVGEI